jgi:hypothetical protein
MYRTGVTSFAYIPLTTASPDEAPDLLEGIAKKVEGAKRDGRLPPGLAEQFDIQLDVLRNDTLPDVEITAVPLHMVAPSECVDTAVRDSSDPCAEALRNLGRVT